MNLRHLRENRRHGEPGFPVGIYAMEDQSGQPLLEMHWHEEAEFLLVESGQALFRIGAAEIELRAGEAVFVPGGELHGAFELEGAACSYKAIVFDMDWLIDAKDGFSSRFLQPLRRGRIALNVPIAGDTEWGAKALEGLARLFALDASPDPAREMRVKAGLYMLLAEFWTSGAWSARQAELPSDVRVVERLKEALTYIDNHYGRKLTVRELAAAAGMSEGHFSRTFKSYMGKTPVEYINHFRLRHAAARLAGADLTVGEAAIEAGFDNFSYFSKMFRSLFQCSPSEYRRIAHSAAQGRASSGEADH
ncbi:AraC family transcriptional regulator [Cohnella thermotolerans]|uniref:AraC family transcriptional regulator n=1 Tax=Cohnella thermotolerans TaxID=329858 RepID=UPI000403EB59|nr:helix-turn-helix domain-containing protein [Cohnella thermotolerans]